MISFPSAPPASRSDPPSLPPAPDPAAPSVQDRMAETDPLRRAAEELETVFIAEMLKSAGLNDTPDGFGGGAGEEQFQSFLVRAQAEQIVRSGGVGLAESLFHALKDD